MAILPSFISYPQGRLPPTQRPLRLEAAILSRIRSDVTSRSNWAKDKSTLSVSRPIEVACVGKQNAAVRADHVGRRERKRPVVRRSGFVRNVQLESVVHRAQFVGAGI